MMYDEDYKLWVSGNSSVSIVTGRVSASEESYFDIGQKPETPSQKHVDQLWSSIRLIFSGY
jgi:hypothetical protein